MMSEEMRAVVDRQAADEGLWFVSATAPETYLQEALRNLHRYIEEMWIPKVAQLEADLADEELRSGVYDMNFQKAHKENDAPREKYYELIFAVGTKHPDETRHETALRYILEAEQGSSEAKGDTLLTGESE